MTDLLRALHDLGVLVLGGGLSVLMVIAVVGFFLALIWALDRAYERWKFR